MAFTQTHRHACTNSHIHTDTCTNTCTCTYTCTNTHTHISPTLASWHRREILGVARQWTFLPATVLPATLHACALTPHEQEVWIAVRCDGVHVLSSRFEVMESISFAALQSFGPSAGEWLMAIGGLGGGRGLRVAEMLLLSPSVPTTSSERKREHVCMSESVCECVMHHQHTTNTLQCR